MARVQGLYIISVAAQILDMHPQTLRKYERVGFIEPPRMGTLRLYSEEDIARLRLIKYLTDKLGLNLAGVELALNLIERLLHLRGRLTGSEDQEQTRAQVVKEFDEILGLLGVEVVEARPAPESETRVGGTMIQRRSPGQANPVRTTQTPSSPRRVTVEVLGGRSNA